MNLLERLRTALGESLAHGVEAGIGAVGLGMFTTDGRQIGATVKETGHTMLDISDGGETWSDLWMDGYVGTAPTTAVRDKLEAICRMYGVHWDRRTRSIVCPAEPDKFPDVARRIAAASIAIDGWKLWLTERDAMAERADAIVRNVRTIATRHRWDVEEYAPVRGQRYTEWNARALLTRTGRQVALTFIDDQTRERVMQRALAWIVDTSVPLIFVVQSNIANDVQNASIFANRATIVPRQRTGTPEAVVEAAERIAA